MTEKELWEQQMREKGAMTQAEVKEAYGMPCELCDHWDGSCSKNDSYRPRGVPMLNGPDPEIHVRLKGGCPDFSDDQAEVVVTMGSYWSSGRAYI